jgi:hypothetical protein
MSIENPHLKLAAAAALALLAGCTHVALAPMSSPNVPQIEIPNVGPISFQPQVVCQNLAGMLISPAEIDLPSGRTMIDSAVLVPASDLAMAARAGTPAGAISPAMPQRCKLLGHISPRDPSAPDINFQINLPVRWNGRSVQYGGGGFNGVLITG